jgi:hypothetical protein
MCDIFTNIFNFISFYLVENMANSPRIFAGNLFTLDMNPRDGRDFRVPNRKTSYESLCNKESFLCQMFAGPIQGLFFVTFVGRIFCIEISKFCIRIPAHLPSRGFIISVNKFPAKILGLLAMFSTK